MTREVVVLSPVCNKRYRMLLVCAFRNCSGLACVFSIQDEYKPVSIGKGW